MNNERNVTFEYVNYEGVRAVRTATPERIYFGSTEFHPEPQWLMVAYDTTKCAWREFALSDCNFRMENNTSQSTIDDLPARGKAKYIKYTDSFDMHSNRFPAWEELSINEQRTWIMKYTKEGE